MRFPGRALTTVLAALALSFAAGCVTPGRKAALAFQYETRDELFGSLGANRPLAVGASVDVTVHRHKPGHDGLTIAMGGSIVPGAGYERAPVSSAASSDEGVLRVVVSPDGSHLRITAVAPGSATVTVQSGEARDTIDFRVAAIERASIDHWLRALVLGDRFSSDAAFVKGATGRFILQLHDAGGRLVGSAMAPPIAIDPAGAAAALPIADGDVGHASVRFDRTGTTALVPHHGERLAVMVVEPDQLEGLEIVEMRVPELHLAAEWRDERWKRPPEIVPATPRPDLLAAPDGWEEGALHGIVVRGVRKGGSAVVLLGDAARVEGRTPDVCVPEPFEKLGLILGDGLTLIRTRSAGSCELEARLGSRSIRLTIALSPKPKKD